MGINPLAAARKEAQRQTYIDEERKLVELGKRRTDAARKAASENKEKDLIGARNAETESVFDKIGRDYVEGSRKEKEDEKDDEWLREFETSLKEETGVSPRDKAVKQRNETVVNTYNTGEEWLMNDGDNDLAKGFINRARSSVGKGVEDFAYMLNDIAPWYEPAKNIVEKNTAGNISAKADKQFENAKSRTGDFGDNLIDIADGAAETLGLSMFGPKALTYAFGTKEGFGEYRKQRENGVSKEIAFRRALAKAGYSVAVEKVDDFIGKNNPINDVLFLNSHQHNSNENKKFMEALNSRNTNDIIITKEQIGKKIGEHTKEYSFNPGKEEDRIKLLNIIDDVINNADEVVVGDNWRHQVGHPIFYIKGEDVVVAMENDKKFVTILKGGITNERVKKARGR